jgi:hypothetical protein
LREQACEVWETSNKGMHCKNIGDHWTENRFHIPVFKVLASHTFPVIRVTKTFPRNFLTLKSETNSIQQLENIASILVLEVATKIICMIVVI